MDKNTITGLILMCLVITGFMWLNKPSEEQLAEQRRAQAEKVEQAKKEQAVVAVADTLNAEDLNAIKAVLAQYGDSSTHSLKAEGVNLRMTDGDVEGEVTVGGKAVSLASLKTSGKLDAKEQNTAMNKLREVVNGYVRNGAFASHLSGKAETITIANDSLRLELSSKGGVISRATLLGYKAYNAPNVDVFTPEDNNYSFTLNTNSQRFDTKDFYFIPEQINDSTVLMSLNLDGGAKWGLRYTLIPGSYMVKMEVVQENMTNVIPTNITIMDFNWTHKMARHEEGKMFEERNSAIYFKYAGKDGDVKYLKESGSDSKDVQDRIKWFSTKNQFFSAALIADSYFVGGQMQSDEISKDSPEYADYLKTMSITSQLEYSSENPNPASFHFYLGPNKYHVLSSYDKYSPDEDLKLTHLIPLGWKLFRWINTGVIIPIFNWLGKYIANYGIIILVLTIIIKIVLSPFTFKSYMSQAKMRLLAPDIKAINDKYPDQADALKRQQKTMELYSRAGANPMGGCLPMLLQMPILFAMFTFFPSCIELRGQSFLWAQDLSAPDAIVRWSGQIPFVTNYFGNHLSLFCLLMTVTNIAYTYLTMQSQQQSQAMPGMKWMMYLMPIMFLVFFNNYASGLSYYYFVSLLITIMQTYACRAFVSEEKVRAKMAENAKKPKKKSGLMARLEEAQRQQQAMLKEQERRSKKRN
ncbi:MAG: membrane protein insertase YidC [Muribaculaceae bacterium]|nr:membrane protein insertase YidC [Muribaculaceae bacterium]